MFNNFHSIFNKFFKVHKEKKSKEKNRSTLGNSVIKSFYQDIHKFV